ncbi:MAG TPA: transglutaminaseTgpA domain-containing protein [Mycobacteriales bacterium]|nr:transglutaminaseTgpA domain-containing protein [Mycobacteriales bacterium]
MTAPVAPPEESRLLRLVVVVAVALGVLAVAVQQAVPAWLAVLAIALLPVAASVAHQFRCGAPAWVKAAAVVLVLFGLARARQGFAAIETLDEARYPLAELFVVVQVAHALDMPRRRDLYVSLGSSLVLLAVAGSLSQDMRFALSLVPWTAAALAALVLAHRAALAEGTVTASPAPEAPTGRPAEASALARHVLRGAAVATAAGLLVFLVVPPPTRGGQLTLPFQRGAGGATAGGGLLRAPESASGGEGRARAATYYGVSPRMDLRVRGELPDELVMRVHAQAPAMWRGAVFDTYDGTTWVGDETRGRDLGLGPVFRLPRREVPGPRQSATQTFFLEADLPTAIYTAAEPLTVYFPTGVSIDRFGLPRAEATLDDGLVYSVVSSYGVASEAALRAAPPVRVDRFTPYLALPDALPERVRSLAAEVTAGAATDYDRVRLLESYLRRTFTYRLDSPVPPAGRDAVDHFLFEAREGFCEQFAAALAVMARSLGIPARVAAGYVPGRYNPFTGYYSVRGTDAHAWVEVYHEGLGWYSYDPTSSVPSPRRSILDRVPLVRAARWVRAHVASLEPAARIMVAAAAVALVGGAVAFLVRRRRRRAADEPRRQLRPVVPSGPATAALARLDAALAARGQPRRPWETPSELLTRAAARAAVPAVEEEAFAADRASPGSVRAAAVIDEAISALGSRSGDRRT